MLRSAAQELLASVFTTLFHDVARLDKNFSRLDDNIP